MSSRRRFDPTIDYYAILRVERTATRDEITRSYRRLMRQSHPDRFSDPVEQRSAEERAKDLNAAYAVLSRPEVRQEYDRATNERLAAQTMRSRYATPRSTVPSRRSTYTQRRSATRPRVSQTIRPEQKSIYSRAIRRLIGTFIGITLGLMFLILLGAIALTGLRLLAG